MLLSEVFDSKIIYYQCEKDWLSLVGPQGWRTLAWESVNFQEVFFEPIIHYLSILLKSWNSFSDFRVDPAVDSNI